MKKLWFIVLALVMSLTLCFSLTACGDKTVEQLQNEIGALLEGGGFEEGSVLNFDKVDATSDQADEIFETLGKIGVTITEEAKAFIYDISVTKDGQEVQPNGKVKITVPMPQDGAENGYFVYHIGDDGKAVEIPSTYVDGKLSFETDGFSYYVIVAGEYVQTNTPGGNQQENYGRYQHQLTITVEPANGGHIEINGEEKDASNGIYLNAGEFYSLQAIENEGYVFVGWYEGDELLAEDDAYSHYLNKSCHLVAKFKEAPYTLELKDGEGGTVVLNGETVQVPCTEQIDRQSSVTLTATPDTVYEFVGWYDTASSTLLSDRATYTFTMDGDRSIEARFEQKRAGVLFEITPNGGGYLAYNDKKYDKIAEDWEIGVKYEVKAVSNFGYQFSHWEIGNEKIRDEVLSVIVPESGLSYRAVFDEVHYCLEISVVGGGKIRDRETLDGATEYRAVFSNPQQTVAMIAEPDEGYHFVGWFEGDLLLSAETNYEVSVDGKIKLEARFEKGELPAPDDPILTVIAGEGGKVTAGYENGKKVAKNTYVTITAAANEGYRLVGWFVGEKKVCSTSNYSFTIDKDTTVVAKFEEAPCTLELNIVGGGYIEFDGERIAAQTQKTIDRRASVTLAAMEELPYQFAGWYDKETSELLSTSVIYTFTMDGDKAIVAKFKQDSVSVSFEASPTGGGYFLYNNTQYDSMAENWEIGTEYEVKAVPNFGYQFLYWEVADGDAGVGTGPDDVLRGTVPKNGLSCTAVFREVNDCLEATVDGNGKISDDSGEWMIEYRKAFTTAGKWVDLYAEAEEGYHFVGWFDEEGISVSTNAAYGFTVSGKIKLTAKFEKDETPTPVEVTLTATAGEGGKVTAGYENGKKVEKGTSVTLTATANTKYHFVGWFVGETKVSNNARYTFTVNADTTLVAKFEKDLPVKVSVTVTPEGAGYFELADGTTCTKIDEQMEVGTSFTVTAVANFGYKFLHWENMDTNEVYSYGYGARTISVTENGVNYRAVFEKLPNRLVVTATDGGKICATVNGETSDGSFVTEYKNAFRNITSVELNAQVGVSGYRFIGWYDGDGKLLGSGIDYTVSVDGEVTVVAKFEKDETPTPVEVTLTATAGEGGTITDGYANGKKVEKGTSVTLTATANTKYHFVGWFLGETKVSDNASYTFTVNADTTLVAKFEKDAPTTYRFLCEIRGNGSIWENNANATATYQYGAALAAGTKITLTAKADTYWQFKGWYKSDDDSLISANATYTFELSDHTLVCAVFEEQPMVTFTAGPDPHDGGHLTENGQTVDLENGRAVATGTQITLTAVAADGYTFQYWYRIGANRQEVSISTDATYTFTVEDSMIVYAKFAKDAADTFLFIAAADPYNGGHIEENTQVVEFGNGREVTAGTKIKLTAVAYESYTFKGWGTRDDNGEMHIFSTEETYEFTVTATTYVYAVFEEKVTALELDGMNAGFTYEYPAEGAPVIADKTTVQIGAEFTPKPDYVVVYAVKASEKVYLTKDVDYTIDLGGLDFTKVGTYTITYTYKNDTSITATLVVEVVAKPADGSLTEAEWNAAMAYWASQTNVKVFERIVTSQSYDQQYGAMGAQIMIYQLAGTAYSEDGYFEDDPLSQQYKGKMHYLAKVGNGYYKYEWNDGDWDSDTQTYINSFWMKNDYLAKEQYDDALSREIYACSKGDGTLIVFSYENFTYDAATKAYKNSDGDITIAFTFDDNKVLTKIVVTRTTEYGNTYTRTITFGDAVVDVPTEAKCSFSIGVKTEDAYWVGGYITENGEEAEYWYDYLDDGTVLTLTAVANDGYVFKCWGKDVWDVDIGGNVWVTYSTDATYTVTVDGEDGALYALFEEVGTNS